MNGSDLIDKHAILKPPVSFQVLFFDTEVGDTYAMGPTIIVRLAGLNRFVVSRTNVVVAGRHRFLNSS